MQDMFPDRKPNAIWATLVKDRSGAVSMGKLAFMGVLISFLLIPVGMIKDLVSERERTRASAENEVVGKWGGTQQVAGPILTVPYVIRSSRAGGGIDSLIRYAHFLPEVLQAAGKLDPEIRRRGIFEVALFKADVAFEGRFARPDFSVWKIPDGDVLWDEAVLTLSIPDVRSLSDALPVEWRGLAREFVPENFAGSPVAGGLHARAPLGEAPPGTEGYAFRFRAHLNGSGSMKFLPMGRETRVSIASPWRTPAFTGAFLPRDSEVGADGFQARWMTLHLSRSFPQSWKHAEVSAKDWGDYAFGVDLLLPIDGYQKATRCAKYAILFIVLTFLVFYMNETLDRKRIHPLQYLLVGAALCLFYLLLLALTEHIPFDYAYAAAALGIVAMITAYGLAVLSTRKRALALGAMLAGLYGYLFSLLQMEDFALLMGSLGLFAILGAVMFLTRKLGREGAAP